MADTRRKMMTRKTKRRARQVERKVERKVAKNLRMRASGARAISLKTGMHEIKKYMFICKVV